VRITVLGKSPSWQDVDGACSSYLVEEQGFRMVVDCGNGAFAKLRRFADYADVDAVVISHLHADHFLDLVPFSYALRFGPSAAAPGDAAAKRPVLHAPPGAQECFRRVTGAWGSEDLIESAFTLSEYDPAQVLHAGPLTLRFQPVPHFVDSNAIEITSAADGTRFTFGADSGPSEDLCRFALDTDLLLLEATLPVPEDDGPRGHMTAAEAGEHGRKARARRLVLTHLTDELDAVAAEEAAEQAFGGAVEIAREGAVYDL
jgi:ribonuclease BN (tRNA processing enzyme)